MTLTANHEVDHYIDQEIRSLQVSAGEHIYKGAFLGLSHTGHVRALLPGDTFMGIAYEEIDNSDGNDGDLAVRYYTYGDFGHRLKGALMASISRSVFALSDDTLTFDSRGASYVGVVQDRIAQNEIILRIHTNHIQNNRAAQEVE